MDSKARLGATDMSLEGRPSDIIVVAQERKAQLSFRVRRLCLADIAYIASRRER